jgi:hypothetical protein
MEGTAMKRIFVLLILLLVPVGRLWAVTEGIFTSVTGKIEIKGHQGHMLRIAQKDTTVVEGERIVAGPDAQATLKTFDGSELTISPNTDFWLDKLQQPDPNNKVIQFKLLLGQLFAKVTKLVSAKSSFEINAGGVICGVRGTQYQVKYDPTTNTVYLGVVEGTVYTTSNGQTTDYGPGSSAVFHNGSPLTGGNNGIPVGNGNPGNNGQGNGEGTGNGQGGYGFDGSLWDLNHQFLVITNAQGTELNGNFDPNGHQGDSNGNNTFTDKSVEGSLQENITANIPIQENVP